jgi:hypothetical protein
MEMLRLNTRHALPQTTIRNHLGRIDKSTYVPAKVHTNLELGKSNQGVVQPTLQMNNYPSRRSWGARNLTDLTREFGQKGISDVRSGTSKRTQIAWERAENGGKPGDDIISQVKNEIYNVEPKTLVEFDLMEGPQITYTPARVVGTPEVGDVTAEIETEPFADIHFKPGSLRTYLQNEGYIRRYVTMNEYDIYA